MAEAHELFGKQLLQKLLIPALLAVLAYAGLLIYGDARAVAEAVQHVAPSALAAVLLVSFASFALRALRWRLYLLEVAPVVPFRESVGLFFAGLAMSITPGKVGELLKSVLLKQAWDVPIANSLPATIAERLSDLAALLILGGSGLLWGTNRLAAVSLAVAIFLGFFVAGRARWVGQLLVGAARKVRRLEPYAHKIATAHGSLRALWKPSTFCAAAGLSLLAWGLQVWIVVLMADSLGGPPVSLPQASIAYAAPLLAGTLAMLPGGLGVTEATMTGTLRELSGMSATSATALTILVRVVTFWFAVVLGLVALGTLRAWSPSHALLTRSDPRAP